MSAPTGRRLLPGEVREAAGSHAQRRYQLTLLLRVVAVLVVLWLLGRLLDVAWPRDLSQLGGRTSYSHKADGYRGLLELSRALGHDAEPRRSSYGQLPAAGSGLLLMIDPLTTDALEQRHGQSSDRGQLQTLGRWLAAGGRILATGPARSLERVSLFGATVEIPSGSLQEQLGDTALDGVLEGDMPRTQWRQVRTELVWETAWGGSSERWSLPSGVGARLAAAFLAPSSASRGSADESAAEPRIQVFSDPLPADWEVVARLDGHPFVVLQRLHDGEAWLVSSAWPFCNLALARHGTAGFAARLLALAGDGPRRALLFDEYGHGLWERKGWLFWLRQDLLLYPTLGLAAVVLLLVWRGSQRFGAARTAPAQARRAKEEFVLGLADVAARAGRHRAAARSLIATHQALLSRHGLGTSDEPGWSRLSERTRAPARFGAAELRTLAREAQALYDSQLARAGTAPRAAGPTARARAGSRG